MPAFDLVIFDCDGVLVDSEAIDCEVVAALLAEAGIPVSAHDINRLSRGRSDRDMWLILEREYGVTVPPSVHERYEPAIFEALARRVQPVKGVMPVVEALHAAGQAICVASSGTTAKMEVTLGATGLARYFDAHIFSATQVEHGKPAPDLFLHAAASMGVPAARSAVIEDSRAGVEAGLAAGMNVFGYAPRPDREGLAALGVVTFAYMSQLASLLGMHGQGRQPVP